MWENIKFLLVSTVNLKEKQKTQKTLRTKEGETKNEIVIYNQEQKLKSLYQLLVFLSVL